ncbi:MAG: aquaporin family protein [Acidobacteria bacterium]|nr:aquaporin family protein [Acidobacteriota bacterium]
MTSVTRADLPRRLAAEAIGTALLLATVVGSGIMGDRLSEGNVGIALLANSLATGAMLVVLITLFAPISGAHFNPAVTMVEAIGGRLRAADAAAFVCVQIAAAVAGVLIAHVMFDEVLWQVSAHARNGSSQWFSEGIATFGLVIAIAGAVRHRPAAVAAIVGLYITAAYWFTASTSFANPAVTIARMFTDTFAGIRPADAPAFIGAQVIGALAATGLWRWLGR